MNEQSPVRSAEIPVFPGAAPEKQAQPDTPQGRKFLLSLAHKLRDNETALGLMRNAFRMFQRMGITVSPNHY